MRWPHALNRLDAALKDTQGEAGTFTSVASGQSVRTTFVRARSNLSVQDTDGAIMQVLSWDFLVRTSELDPLAVFPFDHYIPSKGDTVTLDSGERYELMAPPYSPSDHQGLRLRLHSVRIT